MGDDDLDDFINAWLAPKQRRWFRMQDIIRTADKLAEIRREIAMRHNAYPKWVEAGRLTQQKSDYQLRVMEAIAADYERALEREGTSIPSALL
jgi:hypothetical protein